MADPGTGDTQLPRLVGFANAGYEYGAGDKEGLEGREVNNTQGVQEPNETLKGGCLPNEHALDEVKIDMASSGVRAENDTAGTSKDIGTDFRKEADIEKILTRIKSHFRRFADSHNRITEHNFKMALADKKGSFFADRFFKFLDKDHSNYIDIAELTWGVNLLLNGTPEEKIGFIFKLYDTDDSGIIEKAELHQVLTSCLVESHMHLKDSHISTLTEALFEEADTDKDEVITQSELQSLLEKYPDVLDNLTSSAAQWLEPTVKGGTDEIAHSKFSCKYLKNNAKKVGFIACFWIINAILFAINAFLHRDQNSWIIFARGCGICLDYDSALVLLLTLRLCLTYLRKTPFVHVLPLDHSVKLHKMVGYAIVFWSVLHTVGHLGNAVILTDTTNLTLPVILFTLEADIGWVAGLAPLTGVVLLVLVVVMMVASLPFVRRNGHFQLFYWVHKLYIPYYILSILHATHFWKWVIVSLVIFVIETLFTFYLSRKDQVYIEKVKLLPSAVTQLVISRPPGFKFRAGDYVYLKIPAVAKYEWHPFTISSAPEQRDTFWVHIRAAGQWTKKIRQYFLTHSSAKESITSADNIVERRASSLAWFARKTSMARDIDASIRRRTISKKVHVQVYVDGPYGGACGEIFDTEHAVLIGGGIGVTPFASILQAIINRFKAGVVTCPKCGHGWCHMPANMMRLKKVDFVWINRDQRHFEWFLDLLNKVESEQAKELTIKDAITTHMFITGAPKKDEVQGLGLQVALDIIHNTQQMDLITGLKTRTVAGRPDFDKLLRDIKQRAAGKIKVFMCGSPSLAKTIKGHCINHGIAFSKEQF